MRSSATKPPHGGWAGPDGCLGSYIQEESEKTLKAYKEQPRLVDRDGKAEGFLARGGYAGRQLFELVQNSADSLEGTAGGRIQIHLTPQYLYCADEGSPIDKNGVTALMFQYISTKQGMDQIGRFGLGFNAVLEVTNNPEFFSRLGSFRFSRSDTMKQIKEHVPDAQSYPCLSLAYPIDPMPEFDRDPLLQNLSSWAMNIVRLPLKSDKYEVLLEQIENFPPELLLFVKHIDKLRLDTDEYSSTSSISERDGLYFLNKDGDISTWKLFEKTYKLSNDALEDGRPVYESNCCRITWAVPIDRMKSTDYRQFWIFFPTETASLVSGILNTLWKPYEDRHNLLPGVYNRELICDAVSLIVDSLPNLNTNNDPALHLDALPRGRVASDGELTELLRNQLYMELKDHKIVPDQNGVLQKIRQILYPPKKLPSEALERWVSSHHRPSDWLHHSALTASRRATIDRIFQATDRSVWSTGSLSAPESSISDWLEALVENMHSEEDAIQASIAAIQTAALLPEDIRHSNNLGRIVLTADNGWQNLDPRFVYLSSKDNNQATSDIVHPQLEADTDTLRVLKEIFELTPITPDISFSKRVAILYRNEKWTKLWELSRDNTVLWQEIIQNQRGWYDNLRLHSLSGKWKPISELLLPGSIIPDDGTRDKDFAVDVSFHRDIPLLKRLGMSDIPNYGYDYKIKDGFNYRQYLDSCFKIYRQEELPSNPRYDKMEFLETITVGPLNIFENLSEQGKVKYTDALLHIKETFDSWTLHHKTRDEYKFDNGIYPRKDFCSPVIDALYKYGRVELYYGIVNLSLGIGQQPNPDVRNWLLRHPHSKLICEAFNIDRVTSVKAVHTTEPLPLIDEWPGLKEYLDDPEYLTLDLIRCGKFEVGDSDFELDCFKRDNNIYLKHQYDEKDELQSVLRELSLNLTDDKINMIISRQTPGEISAARAAIYSKTTDVERLLEAVGETSLLIELPEELKIWFKDYEDINRSLRIAEAAIATYDVRTLQKYRFHLSHLRPPKQWAGRNPAVEFVTSLGFGIEWAGQPNISRPPFVEVKGPYSLPCLHPYQRKIADNLRRMLRTDGGEEKRGLISLPTGSGKTRIAVQSIVEAICTGEYTGDVLWIADRDELCEQAVEAWHQVWSNMGREAEPLRISRLWQGNKTPLAINYQHVIVASIQRLTSRVVRRNEDSRFLEDCWLVVFDEAHRSIAPTYTEVMAKLGLTYRRRVDEPFLLGLTATPYRGHNEEETIRLRNRYRQNRLDAGVFESDDTESVTHELQDTGVLAQADHETIEGSHFVLTEDELRCMLDNQVPWLPDSVQERIGHDQDRTERILKAYDEHLRGRGWPTLVFATSVGHAKTLAALLTMSGVEARSVDSETPSLIRRKVVEDFRDGRLEVLVNYGVFREGFDAPKTRGIMVARPVYSPNLYFQMIGRGLRGPKNGGNERCLILNVMDNIENYEEKLAFTELDWLWARDD